MESIGERLKHKREELGLTVEAAAEATKFRPELIRDVEEGRAGLFGARVYQEGFVRTYARFLGLDGDALIRDQKSEEERAQEALRGLKPSPVARPRLRRIAVGIIAAAAIAVAVLVLVNRSGKRAGGEGEGVGGGAADSSAAQSVQAGSRKMRRVPSPSAQPAPADSGAVAEGRHVGLPGAAGMAAVPGADGGDRLFPRPTPVTVAAPETAGAWPESVAQAPAEAAKVAPAVKAPDVSPASPDEGADQAGAVQTPAGKHTLEILARRSVNLTVRSGDRVVLDNYWMKRGERVVYAGDGPFVIVSLSDRQAVSVSLDDAAVSLPASEEHGLFNWTIPPGR